MFLQISITYLFILLFILPTSVTPYYSEFVVKDCDYGHGNYTKGSQYHQNLKFLLTNLSKSTPEIPANGYFEATRGSSNGSNEVFGHAMCRGDVQLPKDKDCSRCLDYAMDEIGSLCPTKKNAAVLYDHCFLRYSNKNFFGKPTGTEQNMNYTATIKKDREKFVKVREDLFSELLNYATNGSSSPDFFACDQGKVSSDLTVYGLVQCTRDLSKEDCHACLENEIGKFPVYGAYRIGIALLGRSCFIRYQNQLFYKEKNPPPPPPSPQEPSEGNAKGKIIGIVVGVVLFTVAMMSSFWLWRKKNRSHWRKMKGLNGAIPTRPKKSNESQNGGTKIVGIEHLSLKFLDLDEATNHFSKENMIGRGGFGCVYKGILNNQKIAVKRLSDKDSLQAAGQLDKEVTLLAGLKHVNLVSLIGYCIEENEMLLVYEYMPNGSLETHLFDPNSGKGVLNWTSRLSIIDGIVKGIQYLHEDSRLKIFHRDLKPENILLDQDLTPKITDFGISKSSDINQTRNVTTNIIGTGGYMAPEYLYYGQFTTKSDIYSLGVMLLEILTSIRWSKRQNNPQNQDLKSYLSSGWKDASLDEKLAKIECEPYTEAQEKALTNILHIAMLCVDSDPDLRPKISDVRDSIKLCNNSNFKKSHVSPKLKSCNQPEGKVDGSTPQSGQSLETSAAMMNLSSMEISREMNDGVLR